MKAGVLKETWPGEARVAVVPGVVQSLGKAGVELVLETGAGEKAGYPDALYLDKGARLASRDAVLGEAQLLLSVRSLSGSRDQDAITRLARATSWWASSTRCRTARA
jgi:H+-translocating NAD(P) transhydrogenase subunit alpha